MLTGVGIRTVEITLARYELTGSASREPVDHALLGRPRILSFENVLFVIGKVRQKPDIFLDELQEVLMVQCGVECDLSTIWRALKRSGFTMKK
ncbi:hypothetical protein BDV93DRAFT_482585, partial [Ceratobasidium sp. AG-I]